MSAIDTVLLAKPDRAFSFPDEESFCVAGVKFRIDQDTDSGLFGPNVRLWADGVMIFQDRKISVVGGMGKQVHNSYSAITTLDARVSRLRAGRQKAVEEAKLADVYALLTSTPTQTP